MQSQNQLKRTVGMFISTVVFIATIYITYSHESKSNQLVVPASDQIGVNTYNDQAPQPVAKPSAINQVRQFFGEDDSEGEEGGSNLPNQTPPPAIVPKSSPSATMGKGMMASSVYKNGTYSATGSYNSPGGFDQIGLTITLSNDVVTSASATNGAGDGTSSRYQDRFISSFKQYVVGQNIANIYLTKVSGASLTPIGFNDALNQIKSQAKA